MQCGPETVLRRDGRQELKCPRCGAVQQAPALPLFVVTGASGTGKTTITGPLGQRLPDFEVFDADIILHVATPARTPPTRPGSCRPGAPT
jgi:hypothetical protein